MPAIFDILFLSTLSLRRATENHEYHLPDSWDFYPRSPCGERPITDIDFRIIAKISIHALLAESDLLYAMGYYRCRNFYPRSPCGERPVSLSYRWTSAVFLSTLSLRRATNFKKSVSATVPFLSTLSLRRATAIFQHAVVEHFGFLSTLSLRRATAPQISVILII